jgi:sterol desaturase/sphingolipid hydroxylase (fatty acid hydroxylase superfamily)
MTEAGLETLWWWVFWISIILLPALEYLMPRKDEATPWIDRWLTNAGFGVLNSAINALSPVLAIAGAHWAQTNGLGLINMLALPVWAGVLVTISGRSLAEYLVHVSLHKVPLLWRIHRVHHSDPAPNVSTGFRFHPLENGMSAVAGAAVAIVLGFPPIVLAGVVFAEAAASFWGHANMRWPPAFERAVSMIVMTPGVHRLHHSADQPETDSNYGNLLMVWDRLFGTFRAPRASEAGMRFGLDEIAPSQANSFMSQILLPVLPGEVGGSELGGETRGPPQTPGSR